MTTSRTTRIIRFIPVQQESELDWFTEGAAYALGEDPETRACYQHTLKVIREEILPSGEVVTQELNVYEQEVYLPFLVAAPQEAGGLMPVGVGTGPGPATGRGVQ
jgi:hypothetical protein